MSSFREKLDALAAIVADEGVQDGRQYHERLDALKVLVAYYTAVSKGKKPEDEPGGLFAGGDLGALEEQHNGSAWIPTPGG